MALFFFSAYSDATGRGRGHSFTTATGVWKANISWFSFISHGDETFQRVIKLVCYKNEIKTKKLNRSYTSVQRSTANSRFTSY